MKTAIRKPGTFEFRRRKALLFLASSLPGFFIGLSSFGQVPPTNSIIPVTRAVMTDSNSVLKQPTNFFAANSNLLNAAVAAGGAGTNAATLTGSQTFSGAKSFTNTADAGDSVILVNSSGKTVTLPDAASHCKGRIYSIKLTVSGSATVATTSSQNIDGATTFSLSAQYKYVTVQSDGAQWWIIANN
jgi:hypothetical protein